MVNKHPDINELSENVIKGVERALRKLVQERAAQNKTMVVKDQDGNIKSVPAKDLLKTLPPQ